MKIESVVLWISCLLLASLSAFSQEPDSAQADPSVLLEEGRFAEAETLARKQLDEASAEFGPDSLEVAVRLAPLIQSLWRQGKVGDPQTLALAERAVSLNETHFGDDSPELAAALADLGIVQLYLGQLETALILQRRALELRERAFEPDDLRVARSLSGVAITLVRLGQFEESREKLERSLAIQEQHLGAEHPDIARGLLNLAHAQEMLSDYRGALASSMRGAEILDATIGPAHPTSARAQGAVARYLSRLGDYEAAIEHARLGRERLLTALGSEHPEYGWASLNLGGYVLMVGRYAEALELTESGYAIVKKALGDGNPLLAYGQLQMAMVKKELGQLDEAIAWQERALAGHLGSNGPESQETLETEEVLGELLIAAGRRPEGIAMLRKNLETRERVRGEDDTLTGRVLYKLAIPVAEDGDHTAAIAMLERSVEIREVALGATHHSIGNTLLELGKARTATGQHEQAMADLERALAIRSEALGDANPGVAQVYQAMADLHVATGKPDLALTAALRAEAIGRDHLRLTARALPETLALRYATIRETALNQALTLAQQLSTPQAIHDVWDAVVRSRAVVLDEMAARNRSLAGDEPELLALAEHVSAARTKMATLTIRSLDTAAAADLAEQVSTAQADQDRAERALAAASAPFAAERARGLAGVDEVLASLEPRTALVAFVRSERFAAFVTRGGGAELELVDLGSVDEVDAAVAAWRDAVTGVPRDQMREREAAYRAAAEALRRIVWDPLVAALGDPDRVVLVPDASLHLVSFAALPMGRRGYLIEQGPLLQYVSSERDIVPVPRGDWGDGLLALGGPAFDAELTEVASVATYRGAGPDCSEFQTRRFESLPQTQEEIADIAKIWNERAGDELGPAAIRTGAEATEATFKREASGHRILHLATHGFFLGDDCAAGADALAPENPLLGAGLVLAGVNQRAELPPDSEDGVLTAEEIGALDLGGVEMAVLSACDTGVGEIRAGEGVLGLRRAFQVAGARTLILSLWPVEDRAARLWMRELYNARLKDGLDPVEAATQASLALLERQRRGGTGSHPAGWATFITAGTR